MVETSLQFILSTEFADPFNDICQRIFEILSCYHEIKLTKIFDMVGSLFIFDINII